MKISAVTYGFPYCLSNSQFPEFELTTNRMIYELVLAVAQHRTGLPEWDESGKIVSDSVKDWTREYGDRLLINLLADYLRIRPNDSMRDVVDYFEHKHGYFMDRLKIKDLVRQLMLAGEIDEIPSMQRAPSEMRDLQRLAKKWLDADVED